MNSINRKFYYLGQFSLLLNPSYVTNNFVFQQDSELTHWAHNLAKLLLIPCSMLCPIVQKQ